MNRYKGLLSIAFFALVIGIIPGATHATDYPSRFIPDNPVGSGVTEERFAEIQDALPCGAQPLQACRTDILAHDVISRMESYGQMYQLHGQMEGDVYTVRLKRYLPDGIYRHGKKHVYLVQNGKRIKLTKGKAYKRMVAAARKGAATPVTPEQLLLMRGELCVEVDQSTSVEAFEEWRACSIKRAQTLNAMSGKLMMNAYTGELWLGVGGMEPPVKVRPRLGKKYDKVNWYTFAKNIAGNQSESLIKDLPSGKKLGF